MAAVTKAVPTKREARPVACGAVVVCAEMEQDAIASPDPDAVAATVPSDVAAISADAMESMDTSAAGAARIVDVSAVDATDDPDAVVAGADWPIVGNVPDAFPSPPLAVGMNT